MIVFPPLVHLYPSFSFTNESQRLIHFVNTSVYEIIKNGQYDI